MNTLLIQFVVAVGVFLAGVAAGVELHAGRDAIALQKATAQREEQAAQQREAADKAAFRHADRLSTVNNQLGDAREKIALLSGRQCLDADTVRMLDAINSVQAGADAGNAAGAPAAAAADSAERADTGAGIRVQRFATERDAAGAIATCRARYAEVSDQLNQYLDREDRLFPPETPAQK